MSALSEHRKHAFRKFIDTFDSGKYWEAHEILEEVWKEDRQDFYKGLIQVAAAWVHLQRKNRSGVLKVLPRALRYLENYLPNYQGWDLKQLVSDCRRCLRSLRAQDQADVSPTGACLIRIADYYEQP